MTRKEALAKLVPIVREEIRNKLNGTNNQIIGQRNVGSKSINVWKYPYPRTRTLLNSLKVVQLRNTVVVSTVYYGQFLESGTRYIQPPRAFFSDSVNDIVQNKLSADMEKALGDEIFAILQKGLK